jgi:hypothetical protein
MLRARQPEHKGPPAGGYNSAMSPNVLTPVVVGVLASRLDFEGRPDGFGVLAGVVFAAFELFGAGIRIHVIPEWRARR